MKRVCTINGFRTGDVVYFDCDYKEGYGIISGINEFGYGEVFLIGNLKNTGHNSTWGSKIHKKFDDSYDEYSSYWNVRVDDYYMELAPNRIR